MACLPGFGRSSCNGWASGDTAGDIPRDKRSRRRIHLFGVPETAPVTAADDTRSLTYTELGKARGISPASAKRLALRHGWHKEPGNDGLARVRVPVTVLEVTPATNSARYPGDTSLATVPVSTLAMVQQEAAELRTQLAQREGELEGMREAMRRADAERDAVWAEAVALRGDMQGERAALQEALRAAQTVAEEAGRQARIAEDRAAAAHQRATEITAVMGRVAEGLEHIRQTQATAAEAVAAAKAEREAALAKVEETAQRAGEAEARAAEASRRAEAAEGRLEEAQRLPAETTPPPNMAELEAAQARATEAERQAAEAEHKANTANERLDRFQRERIIRAQEAAARASEAAELANLEAEAQRPLWQRIFRRRRRP